MRFFVRWILSRIENAFLDSIVIHLFRLQQRRGLQIPGVVRALLLEVLSNDPLRNSADLPEIDLVVPCAEKDQELVRLALCGALRTSMNPIANVVLVTPDGEESVEPELLGILRSDVQNYGATLVVLSDPEVVSEGLVHLVSQSLLHSRNEGWLRQQLIKFLCVLQSSKPACLIVDADTVLLSRKTWLSPEGVQVLAPAEWFREFWTDDVERFLGAPKHLPFSYITHHQLMQKDIVQELMGGNGERLAEWLNTAETVVSEYDSYGSFVEITFPERVKYCRFGNGEIPRGELFGLESFSHLREMTHSRFPHPNSVSAHHYL